MSGNGIVHFIAGEVWNKLNEFEKAPYARAAEEEKRKYEIRMREYTAGVNIVFTLLLLFYIIVSMCSVRLMLAITLRVVTMLLVVVNW